MDGSSPQIEANSAIARALEVQSNLELAYPSFVKTLLRSHCQDRYRMVLLSFLTLLIYGTKKSFWGFQFSPLEGHKNVEKYGLICFFPHFFKQEINKDSELFTCVRNNQGQFAKISRVNCFFNIVYWYIMWQGLPGYFSRQFLPPEDATLIIEDEDGKCYETRYFTRDAMLGAGWRQFCHAHQLDEGDVLVFQLVETTKLKVIIFKLMVIVIGHFHTIKVSHLCIFPWHIQIPFFLYQLHFL